MKQNNFLRQDDEYINQSSPNQLEDFISLEELAAQLNCSTSFLYKRTSKREIPFHKPTGGKIFFSKSEVSEWIKASRVKTCNEIQADLSTNFLKLKS